MASSQASTEWLTYLRPNPKASLRLFCFPYAGGGAHIYRSWANNLPTTVEVCPVQLPGRGNRIKEPPFTNLTSLVEAASVALLPYLHKPFAFFGHSMGAMIGFGLARRLREEHGLEPVHLFISARRPPQIPDTDTPTYNLPDPEFIEELRRLQGTPKEVLEHPELMELMVPLLRADFEICQTDDYTPAPPLHCPITVFGGIKDKDVGRELLEHWREHTDGRFTLRMFAGDHFFLHSCEAQLLEIIGAEMTRALRKLD